MISIRLLQRFKYTNYIFCMQNLSQDPVEMSSYRYMAKNLAMIQQYYQVNLVKQYKHRAEKFN